MSPPVSDLLRSRGAQSRNPNSHTNNNDVLPLHSNTNHNKNGTTSTTGRSAAASTISTNNFLLGGMYVPNKDKRHRYKRRRAFGYSSYGKDSIVAMCQNAYIRYPFMIICVGMFVMIGMIVSQQHRVEDAVGDSSQRRNTYKDQRRTNHHDNIDGLLQDETLKRRLPSILDEANQLTRFTEDRYKYQQQHQQERFRSLEKLVPEWYHRNDPILKIESTTKKTTSESVDKKVDVLISESLRNINNDNDHGTNVNAIKTAQSANSILAGIQHVRPSSNRIRHTLQNNIHNMTEHDQNLPPTSFSSSCPRNLSPTNISVSLLIQSSADRLWILHETCQRWTSPIVVVVAANDDPGSRMILENHMVHWKQDCPQLQWIVYHLDATTESTPESYPVNTLRNVALDAVSTSHILMMDIDFVPSRQLDVMILSALVEQQQAAGTATGPNTTHQHDDSDHVKTAMVIPAFERVLHPPCTSSDECAHHLRTNANFIPQDFGELQTCYNNDNCIIFQSMDNWEGHSSTRTELWLQQKWYTDVVVEHGNATLPKKSKMMRTIPCFDSLRYEPYVVIRWCPSSSDEKSTTTSSNIVPMAPYYDERFHGYGKNKIQLISHLRFMGYQFAVLPSGGFIVHNPHVESSSKAVWNNVHEHALHHTMDALYQSFLNELVSIYLTPHVKNGGIEPNDIVGACHKSAVHAHQQE